MIFIELNRMYVCLYALRGNEQITFDKRFRSGCIIIPFAYLTTK
jgi:hypothetical protein